MADPRGNEASKVNRLTELRDGILVASRDFVGEIKQFLKQVEEQKILAADGRKQSLLQLAEHARPMAASRKNKLWQMAEQQILAPGTKS